MDFLSLFHNPVVLVFLIPVVGIIVGGIVAISKMVMRHRERMALIERGFNPDTIRDDDDD